MNLTRRAVVVGVAAAISFPARAATSGVVMTGHLGNIGSRTYAALAQRGIDRKDGPAFDLTNIGPDARWPALLKGASAVIHLAAEVPPQNDAEVIWRNNVVATANLLAACIRANVPKIIFASSVSVDEARYGLPPSPNGEGPYGRSKIVGEAMMRAIGEAGHASVVAVRIGWAPREDGPRTAEGRARVTTSDLIAAFGNAMDRWLFASGCCSVGGSGYALIEMVKPK